MENDRKFKKDSVMQKIIDNQFGTLAFYNNES